jgi:GDP-L-fucose synthase
MSRRIFVTGGSGFLGQNLLKALRSRGDDVTAPPSRECNLLSDKGLHAWNSQKYDLIFHLAAWTQAGDFCLRHPGEQWIRNQRINTSVLAWWAEQQPQAKLVTIGTSCSYSPDLPLTENHYLQGEPIDSLYTYAMTKRMLWAGQLALAKQFGFRHLTVVPSTLYGQEYHTDGRQLHFIFDLIRKILQAKLHGSPVVLWGDGYQRRELIHVDDFVQATLQLVDSVDNDLVNIGAGKEHTIREFAEQICAHVGYAPQLIQYDTTKYVGAKSKCLDISKLRGMVPAFTPRTSTAGLAEVIDWMRSNRVFTTQHA